MQILLGLNDLKFSTSWELQRVFQKLSGYASTANQRCSDFTLYSNTTENELPDYHVVLENHLACCEQGLDTAKLKSLSDSQMRGPELGCVADVLSRLVWHGRRNCRRASTHQKTWVTTLMPVEDWLHEGSHMPHWGLILLFQERFHTWTSSLMVSLEQTPL